MMKILIIEDEPKTAGVLKDIIIQVQPNTEIMTILGSIQKSVDYLSDSRNLPDLIFMDIQLADGLSFEIFSRVQVKCPVIFCTAYDQYSLQAFKTNGIEYILKPIKEEDVKAAFTKFENLKQSINPESEILDILKSALEHKKSFKTAILVRFKESYIPILISNIALFLVDTEIVYAYTFDNQKHAVFKPIMDIENEINPSQFFRINRQVLINRAAINEIQPYFNRKVVVKTKLKLDEQLIVSRLKVTEFMNWIENPKS
ncbi:MAG TPA: DNA-binding response regulator [Bacteroidales bacterium]|nr:DNA-binding response regulator [Bacteroidales bacterium]